MSKLDGRRSPTVGKKMVTKAMMLLWPALVINTSNAQQRPSPKSAALPGAPSDSLKTSSGAPESVGIFKGLRAVSLGIDVSPALERGGLPKATILEDAELKLRLAGIRLLTRQEVVGSGWPPAPGVFVNVQVVPGVGDWAYLIEVKLRDYVRLTRHLGATAFQIPLVRFGWGTDEAPPQFSGDTWAMSAFGTCDPSKLYLLREPIKDSIDTFVNAYLAENPK